ncbi:M16 family metallopeptidase [Spirochaeta isovalerica]|uniref:Putative Zn-dependent peptidase n=1 Tax=Spirochaeta isovalerica TaxID=150 RepID=A0A841RGX7_9SPIO|nr:insulinase family protein [Spirochaeta isovalerica]MBB6482457.1 putative Zn-dependent peptidase [Spirochaeta isovalerica]
MTYKLLKDSDSAGYLFEHAAGDPFGLRIYTLKNGLKVFISTNLEKPRIKSRIIVRTGSVNDPADSTGMAHYLEHMMFKGTPSIGALDWEKERVLLQDLEDLYEEYCAAPGEQERKDLLKKIDDLSVQLSSLALPGELDRIFTHIGARYTNAHTGFEETVYNNDIPAGELERWLTIEKERFFNPVFRFFPTELEVVYEEFNQEQDDDFQKVSNLLMSSLFPNHPYGSRTILGTGEHLRRPSLKKLKEYYKQWYIPSNMAIALSGDLDIEASIREIDRIWGDIPAGELPVHEPVVEEPLKGPVRKSTYGPDAAFSTVGFRFDGAGSEDDLYLTLIDMMLNNSQAGLFDLKLVQNQKLLEAGTSYLSCRDYSWFIMYGLPRHNQSLDHVAVLLLEQIETLRQGDFEDWMIDSVANYFEISRTQDLESNMVVDSYADAFISGTSWDDYLNKIEKIRAVTKENLVNFVKSRFSDNFILIQKKKGKGKASELMEKPEFSPLKIRHGIESEYFSKIKQEKTRRLKPEFVNFEEAIVRRKTIQGLTINCIGNQSNDLFEFQYIFEIGRNHSKKLALAASYLNYIGTSLYSPSSLQQECFRLGLEMGINTDSSRTYIYLYGRDRYFDKGIDLLEHLLSKAKADKKSYKKFIKGILQKRRDAKLSKRTILNGAMYAWGRYGKDSPFTDILSARELSSISPDELTSLIRELYRFKHSVFYYGPRSCRNIETIVEQRHRIKNLPEPNPAEKVYAEQESDRNRVYFVDYDMAQAEVLLISKQKQFQEELMAMAYVFNEFYGSGMNSIVFQEIREARGLAYSAYSAYTTPGRRDKSHYIHAFIGTQVHKLEEALSAMFGLMNDIPDAEISFEAARESILKNLETERILNNDLFWTYLENNDMGIHRDYREDIYNRIKKMTFDEVKDFFSNNIKGKKFTVLVIGNRKEIDFNSLRNYGEVTELKLKDIFNY